MNPRNILPCNPPINFYWVFAEVAECAKGGLFLSYIYELTLQNQKDNGWFPTECWGWHHDLFITAYELKTIRKRLKKCNVLEEIKKGIPPKIYMRVNIDALRELVNHRSFMGLPHDN